MLTLYLYAIILIEINVPVSIKNIRVPKVTTKCDSKTFPW